MQYKGEDLDLRVPQARMSRDYFTSDYEPSSNGRWSRSSTYGLAAGEPLWVDDILLDCCNYAFDVAQANGAAEVDLEHLVNALTRVDAAARILESRGVREGYLRRESAALIASEVPAANAREATSPRRSGDLEDVLRRAVDVGHRRGSPASVDDVLWVLLHYNRDLPVVQLLRRLTPDWQRLDWAHLRDQSPVPESRSVPVQLVANDSMQMRVASIEDGLRLMQSEFAAERKLLMDLVRDIQRDVVAQRGDSASFRGDLGQRLESLERSVSSRTDVRAQNLLGDRLGHLEQTVQSGMSEALRGTRDVSQRLGLIESVITNVKSDASIPAALGERISALEKAVHNGMGEGARNWANLGQRLGKLETSLAEPREAAGLASIGERIASLERVVETSLAEGARSFGQIGQRLAAFETNISNQAPVQLHETLDTRLASIEQRLDHGGIATRLEELSTLLGSGSDESTRMLGDRLASIEGYLLEGAGPSGSTDTRELAERLGGLERAVRAGFGEAATTLGQIAERLVTVERNVFSQSGDRDAMFAIEDRLGALDQRGRQALDATSELVQRLRAVEQSLEARSESVLARTTEVVERLHALEQRPMTEAGIAVDSSTLVGPLEQRLATFDEASHTRAGALQEAVGAISSRLDQLDERIRNDAVVTEEALRGRDQDFDFIYNEIKEVAQSQATLNSAVSDWRTESQEHFSALASRLERIGLPVVAPVAATPPERPPIASASIELPSAIKQKEAARAPVNGTATADASRTSSLSADDYVATPSGHGFLHWLFGTPDVSTAHRETDLQIGRMRDNIREARERRRTEV